MNLVRENNIGGSVQKPSLRLRLSVAAVLLIVGTGLVLAQEITGGNPEAKAHALLVLAESEKSKAVPTLRSNLLSDDNTLRQAAADGLGRAGDKRAVPDLIKSLSDEDSRVRMYAAKSLGSLGDESAIAPLMSIVSNRALTEAERRVATVALGSLHARESAALLTEVANDPSENPKTRAAALSALGRAGNAETIPILVAGLSSPEPALRFNAILGLRQLHNAEAVRSLAQIIDRPEELDYIKEGAIEALGRIGGPEAVSALLNILSRADDYLAMRAAEALAELGATQAESLILDRIAKTADPWVRTRLGNSIANLKGGR
jgi:HEAT repeat protein